MRFYGLFAVSLLLSVTTAARAADPDVVLLPAPVVASVLNYLNTRPYQEVSGVMHDLQRCLQDQIPDGKGVVAERGSCTEITMALHQINPKLAQPPTPHSAKVP